MTDFFKGLGYNFKGLGFLMSHRGLWWYILAPLLINLLVLGLLMAFCLGYFNDLFAFITKPLGSLDITSPTHFLWHILDGLLWFLRLGLKVLLFILSFIFIFMLVFVLSGVINAPFYEALADKILSLNHAQREEALTLKRLWSNLAHSLKIELYKLILLLGFSLLILIASALPIIGPFFCLLGIFFAAWFFALGLSTYPLVLEKKPFSFMLNWALQRKLLLVGLGLPSLIPVMGLLIIPFQVTGGTLLYLDRQTESRT